MTQFIQERTVKPEEEPAELNDSKILVVQSKKLIWRLMTAASLSLLKTLWIIS